MGLNLVKIQDTIEVIAFLDDSIGDITKEDYERYLTTLDESILKLNPEVAPTRFVFKTSLNQKEHRKIMDYQMGVDSDMKINFSLSYMMEDVRISLIDIKNSQGEVLKFYRDSDGYASSKLIGLLQENELIIPFFTARQTFTKKSQPQKVTKKN